MSSPHSVPPRRGFTLIELLAVCAVVAVLVALLLPAVQQAREAARKAACLNNLHQVALAVHNYESLHRSFPVGCLGCRAPRPRPAGFRYVRRSWNVALLPFLGREPVAASYRDDAGFDAAENRAAAGTVLPVFLCPGTDGTVRRDGLPTTGDVNGNGAWDRGDGLAWTDYGGLFGVGYAVPTPRPEDEGVMLYDRAVRTRDVRDGLTQTAAVGECAGRGVRSDGQWANGHNIFDQRSNGRINASRDNELFADHAGGVNLAFCDGRARFLAEDTEQAVLRALLTRSGGELISAD